MMSIGAKLHILRAAAQMQAVKFTHLRYKVNVNRRMGITSYNLCQKNRSIHGLAPINVLEWHVCVCIF